MIKSVEKHRNFRLSEFPKKLQLKLYAILFFRNHAFIFNEVILTVVINAIS